LRARVSVAGGVGDAGVLKGDDVGGVGLDVGRAGFAVFVDRHVSDAVNSNQRSGLCEDRCAAQAGQGDETFFHDE
jgi:hypothetical protein